MNTSRKLLQTAYIYGLNHNHNLNNFIEKTVIMKDPTHKLVEYYEKNDKRISGMGY